jgi:hypothetical protein
MVSTRLAPRFGVFQRWNAVEIRSMQSFVTRENHPSRVAICQFGIAGHSCAGSKVYLFERALVSVPGAEFDFLYVVSHGSILDLVPDVD